MKRVNSPLSLTTSLLPRMFSRSALVFLLLLILAKRLPAQINQANCVAGSTSLACLTAVALTPPPQSGVSFSPASLLQLSASPINPQTNKPVFSPNTLEFLSGDIGTEVGQIPLASPASGIIYANNPVTQLPERLDQSFGPILTQRAQTIGRHKWYLATTYQYFLLKDIDSQGLNSTGAVIYLNSQNNSASNPPDFAGVSNNNIQLKVHQFVGYITYGLANGVDVSVAVPLLRVDLRETFAENVFHNPNSSTPCSVSGAPSCNFTLSNTRAGEATGIGDVVLATKVRAWKFRYGDRDHGGLSLGVEVRLPSGDSHNFLGSGAFGAKPFATVSYAGRFAPHLNFGYQINGKTDLISVANSAGTALVKGALPNRLIFSGGVDFKAFKSLTINVDGIDQHVFDAQRASLLPANTPLFSLNSSIFTGIPVVQPVTASYERADAAGGVKWNPFPGFLITGNVSVKLNQAGLRSRVVPLVGASLTF